MDASGFEVCKKLTRHPEGVQRDCYSGGTIAFTLAARGHKKTSSRSPRKRHTTYPDQKPGILFSLPLIFPLNRGRTWHLSFQISMDCSQKNQVSGCQGFKGPIPSTLLDELSETSFHSFFLHHSLLSVPESFNFSSMGKQERCITEKITCLGDFISRQCALAYFRTVPGRAAMLLLMPRLSE